MDLLPGIKSPCSSNLEGPPAQMFLTLINMLVASHCPLGSKDHYPQDYAPQLFDKEEFDFIVVGGGSSGSVVANRLSENPKWSILVLEAGGYPSATSDIPSLLFSLQGTQEDWRYKTETSENSCKAYKDERCRWPRGKVLGGSSTINAMIYTRGSSNDYEEWAKEGNSKWSYNDLKIHFNKIENLRSIKDTEVHGTEGFQNLSWYLTNEPITNNIIKSAEKLGYPALLEQDPEDPLGYYQALFTTDSGVRMNAARAFVGQIKERGNLKIATKAHVRKILIDKSSLAASGVEVQIGGKILNILAKKEVVLSAGSLNTPQILMLSGVGPKADLEKFDIEFLKDLAGVGQNLQDHVVVPLFFKIAENGFKPRPQRHVLDDLYNYFMHRTGPMSKIDITNLMGFITTKNDSQYPNIQLLHVGHRKEDKYLLPIAYSSFGLNDDILLELQKVNLNSNILNVMPVLLNPKSRGSVQLKSEDFLESPRFYSGYFSDENGEDMKTMVKAIRFVQKLFATRLLYKFSPEHVKLTPPACDALQYDSDEYWRCFIRHFATTIYHQVGTAKMGPNSDDMAVVDDRLRVYGIKNLRVIDGSIMPKITSGNTNAPCLVIGYKGGEMIIEDWREEGNNHEEL